jgi:hypothetical protein
MKRMTMILALVSVLIAAACGGGENQMIDEAVFDTRGAAVETSPAGPDSPGGAAAVPEVESGHPIAVTLQENSIGISTTIPPGPIVFTAMNGGTEQHSLAVEQQGGIAQRLNTPLEPGQSGSMEVVLQPGPARAFCPILEHASRGESVDIQVSP